MTNNVFLQNRMLAKSYQNITWYPKNMYSFYVSVKITKYPEGHTKTISVPRVQKASIFEMFIAWLFFLKNKIQIS